MELPLATQVVESRLDEEDQILARVSSSTLEYMYSYGLMHEARLTWHRGNLAFLACEEHDLFEAMRLSVRLTSVDRNISRTGRRNERMRSELVRRTWNEGRGAGREDPPIGLYNGEAAW